MRRWSLDELPQLLNVLKGDMSVVGPRPHAVDHNEQYCKLIPGYMARKMAEEHFGQDSVLQRFEQQRLALHC